VKRTGAPPRRVPGILPVTAALSLAVLTFVALLAPTDRRRPAPRESAPTPPSEPAEGGGLLEPVRSPVLRLEQEAGEPEPTPASSPALSPEARRLRVEQAVAELARTLQEGSFHQPTWNTAVEALARSLGDDSGEELRRLIHEPDVAEVELLAASALLERTQARRRTLEPQLAPAVVDELLRTFRAGGGPRSEIAARTLASLGGPLASTELLEATLHHDDPRIRARAARGLQACTDPVVAIELSRLAAAPEPADPALTGTLLRTLEAMVLENPWAFDLATREHVAETLRSAAASGDPSVDRIVRRWNPDASREDIRQRLAERLAVALPDSEEERSLAEAVALERAVPAVSRRTAAAALVRTLERTDDPAWRRRALVRLPNVADPQDVPSVVHAARNDPDPTVRAAGLRALVAIADPQQSDAELRRAIRDDPADQVRRIARHLAEALSDVSADAAGAAYR